MYKNAIKILLSYIQECYIMYKNISRFQSLIVWLPIVWPSQAQLI